MNSYRDMTEQELIDAQYENVTDLGDDHSECDMSAVWDSLTTPIYRVIDEDGVNVAEAKLRRFYGRYWLYVDEVDGYEILESTPDLVVVPEEKYIPLGWDRNGSVVLNG